jgi:hypothetical protein
MILRPNNPLQRTAAAPLAYRTPNTRLVGFEAYPDLRTRRYR